MMISREKRPHQRCLVNAFIRSIVIMSIAYIKCISRLLSKHHNWESSVLVFCTSRFISSSMLVYSFSNNLNENAQLSQKNQCRKIKQVNRQSCIRSRLGQKCCSSFAKVENQLGRLRSFIFCSLLETFVLMRLSANILAMEKADSHVCQRQGKTSLWGFRG